VYEGVHREWTCPGLTDTLLVRGTIQRGGVFLMLKDRPMYSLGVLGLEAVRLVKEGKDQQPRYLEIWVCL